MPQRFGEVPGSRGKVARGGERGAEPQMRPAQTEVITACLAQLDRTFKTVLASSVAPDWFWALPRFVSAIASKLSSLTSSAADTAARVRSMVIAELLCSRATCAKATHARANWYRSPDARLAAHARRAETAASSAAPAKQHSKACDAHALAVIDGETARSVPIA